mgnify:CR=1 FL=1
MYPYIHILGTKISMTWIGIVISCITFLAASGYFCKKYHQNFWRLFYRLPLGIILPYLLGSYVGFALQNTLLPHTLQDVATIIFPHWYKFHFIGTTLGFIISIGIFLFKVKRLENKKIWLDIFFYSISFSLIILWIFLFFWDDFIGKTTQWALAVKSLHSESERNKFSAVYPIWIFLSVLSLIAVFSIRIYRHIKKLTSIGIWGFIILLVLLNIVFMFQQYPRYWVFTVFWLTFDVIQYFTLIVILYLLFVNRRRKRQDQQLLNWQ